VAVFGLLGAGVYVFFQAPQIATADSAASRKVLAEVVIGRTIENYKQLEIGQKSDLMRTLSAMLTSLEKESLPNLELDHDRFISPMTELFPNEPIAEKELQEAALVLINFDFEGAIETFGQRYPELLEDIDSKLSSNAIVSRRRLDGINNIYIEAVSRIEKLLPELRVLPALVDDLGVEREESTDFYLFLSTQITRFGTLAVILFLVGILVGMYRYSARLASYYDARADALVLLGDSPFDIEKFEKLVGTLSPETYDFGRIPASPTDQAVALTKEMLTKIAPNTKGGG